MEIFQRAVEFVFSLKDVVSSLRYTWSSKLGYLYTFEFSN